MRPIDANSAKSSILVVADCLIADCDWVNGYKTGLLAATEAIDEIPTVEAEFVKWIPVTERLPKLGRKVLLYFSKSENMAVGFLRDADDEETMWSVLVGGEYSVVCYHEPTHWMPLPEPPEDGGADNG